MTTPTVCCAVRLIESRGVPIYPAMSSYDDTVAALNAIFAGEFSDDPHQLENLLILAGELLVQACHLQNDPDRAPQRLEYGVAMLQCGIAVARGIADDLGVTHE